MNINERVDAWLVTNPTPREIANRLADAERAAAMFEVMRLFGAMTAEEVQRCKHLAEQFIAAGVVPTQRKYG